MSGTLQASDATGHLAEIGSHLEGGVEGHESSPDFVETVFEMEQACSASQDNRSITMGTPGPFRHRSSTVDLGQITRKYRNTEVLPASPLERFVYQDPSYEPWPMIAKKALSDSGLDATSLRELNERVSFASINTVAQISNPDLLEEAYCSIRSQASGASVAAGGGGRKRSLDDAELRIHGDGSEKAFKRQDTKEDR
ncbi:hypothetical protein AC578_8381 [Pseudocercospora eumusae]|uniref:Uncharacterized protein n=1 Tax=Pseudocercospora eumusae TaxID=321146 RepID=A0A139HS92_9PEZI|nr:hypothetical protein AC578_8381 [Pseudocercospora eumusae]